MMRISLWKRPPETYTEVITSYRKDLIEYTALRNRAKNVDEYKRYDYIIEVMQRTLTELIDRNKE